MADLTPEERNRLREKCDEAHGVVVFAGDLLALLDAHDRLAEQLAIAVEAMEKARWRSDTAAGYAEKEGSLDAGPNSAQVLRLVASETAPALARIAALDPKEGE